MDRDTLVTYLESIGYYKSEFDTHNHYEHNMYHSDGSFPDLYIAIMVTIYDKHYKYDEFYGFIKKMVRLKKLKKIKDNIQWIS